MCPKGLPQGIGVNFSIQFIMENFKILNVLLNSTHHDKMVMWEFQKKTMISFSTQACGYIKLHKSNRECR
jgi:hypothetical protein